MNDTENETKTTYIFACYKIEHGLLNFQTSIQCSEGAPHKAGSLLPYLFLPPPSQQSKLSYYGEQALILLKKKQNSTE